MLTDVRPGTRVRVFHGRGERRTATSGVLLDPREGSLRVRDDRGQEIRIDPAAVTCYYVPKRPRTSGSAVGRLLALLGRRLRSGRPPLAPADPAIGREHGPHAERPVEERVPAGLPA